jgi:tetratricopeptide (TPR) repeat protein
LAVAILIAYANSFSGPFVHLDLPAIVDNPTIRHLTDWRQVLAPPVAGGVTVGGRPLVNLTLALNYAWGGLNPAGYHLVNLLIHTLAALTLFGVVRRTLGPGRVLVAWTAALVWAVHPLQTESVTYVVQRAESLMGLFYLLEFYCFIRAAQSGGKGGAALWAALSILCCLLGMATKEVMVSAPLMVLLYDSAFLAGNWREALRQRGKIHAARFATWIPMAALVIHTGGRGGTAGFGLGITWWTYARTQFVSIVHYLRLALWPTGQVFYAVPDFHLPTSQVVLCGLVVVGLGVATVIAWWRAPKWAFLGTFFFAILAPTSLIPGITQTMAEHRMYLALAPVVVGLVWLVAERINPRPLAWTLLGVGAAALVALTSARNRVYHSSQALWADTVASNPANPYAQNNLGIALAGAGQPAQAAACFALALQAKPDYAEAENNWGLAESSLGDGVAAVEHYQKALRMRPAYAEAHANLGVMLARLQRPEEAVREFRESLRLQPSYAEARNNLAVALAQSGRLTEAIPEYQKVLQVRPASAETHYNLANALAAVGQRTAAIEQYHTALRLQPDNAEAASNLGAVLAQDGQWAAAVKQYDAAVRLAPHDADVHYNLALALRALGRFAEANAEWAEMRRLRAAAPARAP